MRFVHHLLLFFNTTSILFGGKCFLVDAQTSPPPAIQNDELPLCGDNIVLQGHAWETGYLLLPMRVADCVWHASAPEGQHIHLRVTVMETDADEEFRVYDHGTSVDDQYLVSTIRGYPYMDVKPIMSSGQGLTVRYTAYQGRENDPSFRFFALVTTLPTQFSRNEEACGGRVLLTETEQTTIVAPYNLPNTGPHAYWFQTTGRAFKGDGEVSCVWTIEAPADRNIQVTWDHTDTLNEKVSIYDHETVSDDHEVTRLQGVIDWQMPVFVSSGSVIVLYLRQDGLQPDIGNGFSATLQSTDAVNVQPGCGGSIALDENGLATATIRSPYYDITETTGSSIMCWWFITAPYGNQVQVDINDVTTTTNERVRITDGATPSDNPSFEHTFTGTVTVEERLYSGAGGVIIALEDLSVAGPNGRGFSLEVSIAGPGYCEIVGDPHYTSFDGKRFDFQGDCEYTLAKPCTPETDQLPDFHLWGNNVKWTPSSRVSLLKQMFLSYNGSTYSIGQPSGRTIRVDGVQVTAPVNQNGVSITYAYPLLIIETEFGLRVTYDGAHFGRVFLSPAFAGRTCGLCGNFDGNTDNDFTLPDGTVTDDVNLFGFKWSADEDFCTLSMDPTNDPCEQDAALAARIERTCAIFDPVRNGGIFGDCSTYVDHFNYFTSCQFDLCYTHELNKVICASVQEYIILCQTRNPGAVIGEWRNLIEQCSFDCPEGTEYQMCGTACPNTCADRTAAENCPRPCHETCLCPDELVLDGEKCVAVEDCGCTLPNNVYLSSGDIWITPETCEERCGCEGGVVTCQPLGCGENEACVVRNGARGCYCQDNFILNNDGECVQAPATCTISGDPHYTTFDRFTHHFQGDCMYTLVRPCQASDLYPDFHIWGDTIKTSPAATVAYLQTVFLLLNDTTYTLAQGKALQVDGVAKSSINYQDGSVRVWSDASFLTLETAFGVTIQFSGGSLAYIQVSQEFWNNTCGLCGNFDGVRSNEYTTSDGTLTGSVDVFGNSWQTGSQECQGIVTPPNPCDVDPVAQIAAHGACNNLNNLNGPFQTCLDFADPSDTYTSCVFDACVLGADDDAVCDHYEQYAQICQTLGQQAGDWRTPLAQCEFTCPANQEYNSCGSPCPATCTNPTAPDTCPTPCHETCTCPEGLLFDGEWCIEPDQCGCSYEGSYYSNSTTWTSVDCMTSCLCVSGDVVCGTNTCQPSEACSLDSQGAPGCYCRPGLNRIEGICVGEIPPSAEIRVACDGFAMSANVNDAAITEDFEQDDFTAHVVCGVFTYDQTAFTFEKFFESCDEHIARAEVAENDVIFADVATAPLDVLTVGAANPGEDNARTAIFCEFRPVLA